MQSPISSVVILWRLTRDRDKVNVGSNLNLESGSSITQSYSVFSLSVTTVYIICGIFMCINVLSKKEFNIITNRIRIKRCNFVVDKMFRKIRYYAIKLVI